jgi:hypothetical protein
MNRDGKSDTYDGFMEAIWLRWMLRDIRADRFTITPLDPVRLERLIEMGLAEMVDGNPGLTDAGRQMIENT